MDQPGIWESQIPIFDALNQGVAVYARDKSLVVANARARALFAHHGADPQRPQRLAGCALEVLLHRVLEGSETTVIEHSKGVPDERLVLHARRAETADGAVLAVLQLYTGAEFGTDRSLDSARTGLVARMLPGIAHEVRGPLTTISGVAQVTVTCSEIPPDVRAHLGLAHEQVERADQILRSASSFARGPGAEDHLPVSLNDALARCLRLLAYELRSRRVDVDSKLAARLPLIDADPEEVLQLVITLALYSLDCGADGKTRRRIAIRTYSPDDHHAAIELSGPSAPAAAIDLAQVHALAQRLGGHVTVHLHQGQLRVVAVLPAATGPRSRHRPDVLVVSSDLDLLVTALSTLRPYVGEVMVASSIAATAHELQASFPSALLVDLGIAADLIDLKVPETTLILAHPGQESDARALARQRGLEWVAQKDALPRLIELLAEATKGQAPYAFPDLAS